MRLKLMLGARDQYSSYLTVVSVTGPFGNILQRRRPFLFLFKINLRYSITKLFEFCVFFNQTTSPGPNRPPRERFSVLSKICEAIRTRRPGSRDGWFYSLTGGPLKKKRVIL
jgi:hypothetical protein